MKYNSNYITITKCNINKMQSQILKVNILQSRNQ